MQKQSPSTRAELGGRISNLNVNSMVKNLEIS
jgi:hypothetical protein